MGTADPRAPERCSLNRLRSQLVLLGVASVLGYLSIAARMSTRPVSLRWGFPLGEILPVFLLHFLLLFVLVMAAAWLTFRVKADDAKTVTIVLGFAIFFRLLLLPAPPVLSSDIFRYIWDARMQVSGVSPYLAAPADRPPANPEQDLIYQQQNRPFARTIYPPLAQLAFRMTHALGGESVTAMKAVMLLGDLFTLALLMHLLQGLSLPRSRVILYAWHPLVVFEVAGSGHVDALAIPFILLAVRAWRRERDLAAGLALGAATLVKIFPILLLPAFLGRRRRSLLLGCGAVILLGYLPFLPGAGLEVLGHLPRFLADPGEMFNPSLMGLIVVLTSRVSQEPVFWASQIGRLALLLTVLRLIRSQAVSWDDLMARVWLVAGAVVLFTLTLHPWYLLWLVPLLVIQPRVEWIYLSGAIAITYAFYLVTPSARGLISLVEYLPFCLLGWHGCREYATLRSDARWSGAPAGRR